MVIDFQRQRNISVRERHQSVASRTHPNYDSNLQPSGVWDAPPEPPSQGTMPHFLIGSNICFIIIYYTLYLCVKQTWYFWHDNGIVLMLNKSHLLGVNFDIFMNKMIQCLGFDFKIIQKRGKGIESDE